MTHTCVRERMRSSRRCRIRRARTRRGGGGAAGVVEAVGDGVKKVKAGDRVYTAKTISGAYAEFTLAEESQVEKLPANITFDQGAAIWVPYGTAYHALNQEAKALAGETVLVHGASGGVGSAAVQIARAKGLTVFGTAGTDKGLELIKKEGAHQAFNHTKAGYTDEIMKATGGKGVNVILEMLANVNLSADLKIVAQFGRVIVIGNRGEITINPRDIMGKRSTVKGFTLWAATEKEMKEIHAGLYAGLANGTMRPIIGKKIPLAEASRAHKEVLEPGSHGKIVCVP